MRFEKPRTDSKRERMRTALHAALAAASLASGVASAEELRLPPGTNTANRTLSESVHKKTRAKTSSWAATVNPAEDFPATPEYRALLEKMRGVYLHYRESVESYPQFEKFCEEIAIFCEKFADHRPDAASDMTLTPELFARINNEVHRTVNEKIKPMPDITLHGVKEKWTIPAEAGDCEDYVLLKMNRLINEGIDPAYLHIVVVRDENQNGHAVLGVDVLRKGVRNTLVLDNKRIDIVTLSEMEENYEGYLASFITRDSLRGLSVQFSPYDSRSGGSKRR